MTKNCYVKITNLKNDILFIALRVLLFEISISFIDSIFLKTTNQINIIYLWPIAA